MAGTAKPAGTNDSVEGYTDLIVVTSVETIPDAPVRYATVQFPIDDDLDYTVGEYLRDVGFHAGPYTYSIQSITLVKRSEAIDSSITICQSQVRGSSQLRFEYSEPPVEPSFDTDGHATITTSEFLTEVQRSLRRSNQWAVSNDDWVLRSAGQIQLEVAIKQQRTLDEIQTEINSLLKQIDPVLANLNLLLVSTACNLSAEALDKPFDMEGRTIDRLLGGGKSGAGVGDRLRKISGYLEVLDNIRYSLFDQDKDVFLKLKLWSIEQTGVGLVTGRRNVDLRIRVSAGAWLPKLVRQGSLAYVDEKLFSLRTDGHALHRDLLEYVTLTNEHSFTASEFLKHAVPEAELANWGSDRQYRYKTKTNIRNAISRLNELPGYIVVLNEDKTDWLNSTFVFDRPVKYLPTTNKALPAAKPDSKYTYGDLLNLIDTKRVTQTELAKALFISKASITRWKKNKPRDELIPDTYQTAVQAFFEKLQQFNALKQGLKA